MPAVSLTSVKLHEEQLFFTYLLHIWLELSAATIFPCSIILSSSLSASLLRLVLLDLRT